jgi:two-component system chemotaxis response regulator CheY
MTSMRPAAGAPATVRVLLVEPSRTVAGIVRRALPAPFASGLTVVQSGQDALNRVKSDRPEVVISTMQLPDMTGIELARQVREATKATPIGFVLVSSETESKEMGSLSKTGLAVLLHKPFTAEQLLEALHLALPQSAVAPAASPSVTAATLAAPPVPQLAKPAAGRSRLRVLIVDDSTPARMHVRNVLTTLGLTHFVEAVDGAQAVAATARESFDLIVTDYNMPHMDGRGLIGYLKQNPGTAGVPIIMVTTETDPAKLDAVRRLGADLVCDKSFPAAQVQKIIDKLA